MNTMSLLDAKAKNLCQYLPEGAIFSIGAAYGGYQFRFEANADRTCDSSCGYEKRSVAIAQFDAIHTFVDALHRTKSTHFQADNRITEFNQYIQRNGADVDNQASLLSKLAYLLMRELNDDKVNTLCQRVINEGWSQGLLEACDD